MKHRRIYELTAIFLVCCTCSTVGFYCGEIWGENIESFNRGWNIGFGCGYNKCIVDSGYDDPTNLVQIESRVERPSVVEFIADPSATKFICFKNDIP